jgi:cytochrome oxidase Cu insertion factor (SCO1/SenC/PrrC family)
MKKISTAFLALVAYSFFAGSFSSAAAGSDPFIDAGFIPARKKVQAIDFSLNDLNGKPVKLSDYQGKTVLLFFWTTW